jgi:hypothetical protein
MNMCRRICHFLLRLHVCCFVAEPFQLPAALYLILQFLPYLLINTIHLQICHSQNPGFTPRASKNQHTMVYFNQNIVLPPETRDRLDKLLDLLSAFLHKLPNFSSPIDPDAAVNVLKSIDHTFANFEPTLRRIDIFNCMCGR